MNMAFNKRAGCGGLYNKGVWAFVYFKLIKGKRHAWIVYRRAWCCCWRTPNRNRL